MSNKAMDTTLFDKAARFAIEAHSCTERRGKGYAYVLHTMEAASIVATMTNDEELLAAALLHDVIEDTDVTEEELRREFGDRITDIVVAESDDFAPGVSEENSWHDRKRAAIERLAAAPLEAKMVALGDKLSNMRAIAADYDKKGDELWNIFHANDPRDHEWHYKGLADSLIELADTDAYREFRSLVDDTFDKACKAFSYELKDDNTIIVCGHIGGEEALNLEGVMKNGGRYVLDFMRVGRVQFPGIRGLIRAASNGCDFRIRNANHNVADFFSATGANVLIDICERPEYRTDGEWEQAGEGFTAVTYNNSDGVTMKKSFNKFITNDAIEKEKRIAQHAMICGIPTPLSGNLVYEEIPKYDHEDEVCKGILFERIVDKRSIARAIAEEPENTEKYMRQFARLCKKLHTTECYTDIFDDVLDVNREFVAGNTCFSDEEKSKLNEFLDSTISETTCVHGDCHTGNVIFTDKDILFIDMSDFGYGDHRFDLGSVYFTTMMIQDEMADILFHNTAAGLKESWKYFASEYFGIGEPGSSEFDAAIGTINGEMEKFAAMKVVQIGSVSGKLKEYELEIVRNTLLK